MIKLAIFDLDGTILNSLNDLADSCNFILSNNNLQTHNTESYKQFVGNGIEKLIERSVHESKREPIFIHKLISEFILYYSEHSTIKTKPYYGIIDLLEKLQSMQIKLAVASNKKDSETQKLVKYFFPNISFDAVLGKRDGVIPKPNPQIVFDILNKLNIKNKREVIYIGDSNVDMQTAINADIFPIGVEWGFRTVDELIDNGAKLILNKPSDLINFISLNNIRK